MARTDDWLQNEWPMAMHVFRILPSEESSRIALEELGLTRRSFDLPGEQRPFLWYQPAERPS